MKRFFITILALLALVLDLGECTLVGHATFLAAPRLSQGTACSTTPFFENAKVVSDAAEDEVALPPFSHHHPHISPLIPSGWSHEDPNRPPRLLYCQACGAGGIPL